MNEEQHFLSILDSIFTHPSNQRESLNLQQQIVMDVYNQTLAIIIIANSSEYTESQLNLAFTFLMSVHRLRSHKRLPNLPESARVSFDLMLTHAQNPSTQRWASVLRHTFQRAFSRASPQDYQPFTAEVLSCLSSPHQNIVNAGLIAAKALLNTSVCSETCIGFVPELFSVFQCAFAQLFNENTVQNPTILPLGRRILKITSSMIVFCDEFLYRDGYSLRMVAIVLSIVIGMNPTDDSELAALIHLAAVFLSKFLEQIDCRFVNAAHRFEERLAIYEEFAPSFVSVAIPFCLALPSAFPTLWRALGAPLVFALATRINYSPEFAPQLLTVALLYSQIPESEYFEIDTNPVSFYGMAYVNEPCDLSQPRRSAIAIFQQFCPDPALSFLLSQNYSEGLMHLIGSFCELYGASPELLPFIRTFPGQLPLFHELTRLRMLRWFVPQLTFPELEFLMNASHTLLSQSEDPLSFTVGVEVLEKLLEYNGPVVPESIGILIHNAESTLGCAGIRALALLAEHASDVTEFTRGFIQRACRQLGGLWKPGATGWDRDGFKNLCGKIAGMLRRPGCDPPFREIAALARLFLSDEPAQYFAEVLEVAVTFQCSQAIALGRRVLRVLTHSIYIADLSLVVLAFVCAHPNEIGEVGGKIIAYMKRCTEENEICVVARVMAAMLQITQLEVEEICVWGIGMVIEGKGEVVSHAGIEILASAIAGGRAVSLPGEIFEIWGEMIDRGYLATNYFRVLTLTAFVTINPEVVFEERVRRILFNEIPLNLEFYATYRNIRFEGPRMPILSGVTERFPSFVEGEI
jgi:hypothetical protein